jgi:hypothetical protein
MSEIATLVDIIHKKYVDWTSEERDEDYYIFEYKLKAKSIDGIPMHASMLFKNSNREIVFTITSKKINGDDGKFIYYETKLFFDKTSKIKANTASYAIGDIAEATHKLFEEILPNLKFNKLLGKFLMGSDIESNIEIRECMVLELLFSKCENIEPTCQICIVCYEKTQTNTKCDHSLCYYCWERLPQVISNGSSRQLCPACKGVINTNYDDDIISESEASSYADDNA